MDNLLKEKKELIKSYEKRIIKAKEVKHNLRINLLTNTLYCLQNSKSKRDIMDCKSSERKNLMTLIKG